MSHNRGAHSRGATVLGCRRLQKQQKIIRQASFSPLNYIKSTGGVVGPIQLVD